MSNSVTVLEVINKGWESKDCSCPIDIREGKKKVVRGVIQGRDKRPSAPWRIRFVMVEGTIYGDPRNPQNSETIMRRNEMTL